MYSRYALIRYLGADGKTWHVGSGFILRDRVVLTADHVAAGSRHLVECVDRKMRITVRSAIRSGAADVDLAVLMLEKPVSGLTPMECARLDRTRPAKVGGCVAVGFPYWNMVGRERVSVQVEGFVRTGDGLRVLAAGGTDGQLITLIGDRVPGDPDLPEGLVDYGHGSPWGGMSGAVVVSHGMAIGVIHSHRLNKGFQSLTVTPLTAVKLLSPEKYQQFCVALGIASIDEMTVVSGDATEVQLVDAGIRPTAGFSADAAFSGKVRERYASDLVLADLGVLDKWDLRTLEALRRSCQHQAANARAVAALQRSADLLEALCLGLRALPAIGDVGGQVISTRKLQHLYLRHVGCRPESNTLEEMLIEAALVGIAERRTAVEGLDGEHAPLTALARFLLGIAGLWKGPDPVDLSDADLAGVAGLITGGGEGQLGHQWEDAAEYLMSKVRKRTWALIELDAADHPDAKVREWPESVNVSTISERGYTESQRFACPTATREGVEEALRKAVSWLPEGDVYVDLFLPRGWLDAGVEHWDVVEVGGWYESMARHFQPRLRWAMHRRHPRLNDRLRRRFASTDWQSDPEDISGETASTPASLADWLNGRNLPGTRHPPYFTGCSPSTGSYDPLGALLKEGYGFFTWFNSETKACVRQDAVRAAAGLTRQERLDDLPDTLAARLAIHRPTIIWSDPDGRADFQMPPQSEVAPMRAAWSRRRDGR